MASGSRHLARRCAVQALYQWDVTSQDPVEIEPNFISDQSLSGVDVDYFQHLLREIPRHHAEIDTSIASHLDRTLESVDPVERAILRLGAFELMFHPEIPVRVVLNEAIELTQLFGAEQGYKFINGVLDKLATASRTEQGGEGG